MPSYTLSLDPSDLQHYVKATDPVAASAARMLSCSGAGRRAGAVLWTLGQQELASKAFRAVEDVSLYQGGRGKALPCSTWRDGDTSIMMRARGCSQNLPK